jgi:4-hydroxybenzoate polyprenyltransferase
MPIAALRIVADVLAYRLRKLEMANLVGAIAIMVALRLPWSEVAGRTGFAALLNLVVYLNNDYCDIEQDLASGRASAKTRFLSEHRRTAVVVQVALGLVLAALAVGFRPGLLVAGLLGGGICWAYSARLKRMPFADIGAMAAWGLGMTLVAVPLDDPLGWALVVELGLFSAVFETIQVIRDHDDDRARGVTTTAVHLGPSRTLVLARAFMVVAALYGLAVLHRYFALLELAAPLVPFTPRDPGRYWTRVRLVLGLAWLGILGAAFVHGESWGWVVSVARARGVATP